MDTYPIVFWTSEFHQKKESSAFGCTTHGFADHKNWVNPNENKSTYWDEELKGSLFTGKNEQVLTGLKSLDYLPKLCIAFFRMNVDVELFIDRFTQIMPGIPIVGGVDAITGGQLKDELIPESEDIRLLAVSEGSFEVQTLNIYDKTGTEVEIKKTSTRDFEHLRVIPGERWQNAADFYRSCQRDYNVEEGNFESITFSDRNERNHHFSIAGNTLHAGADLPGDNVLQLRVTTKEDVEERVAGFLLSERSLIFGCAGIRSLIQKPLLTGQNSLAGFMFGEIVTIKNKAAFGNLMLTKIKIIEKL